MTHTQEGWSLLAAIVLPLAAGVLAGWLLGSPWWVVVVGVPLLILSRYLISVFTSL
jgi:hypothetical protein